jgi:hypothetical protein
MSKSDLNAKDLKEWAQMTASIVANAPDLPQTDIPRAALEKLTEELRKLVGDQKLHQSTKQQISQRMKVIHGEGAKLATVLRVLVKQHYGNRNDKLVELGVKPFRGRTRKAAPTVAPPPVTGPAPEVSTTPTPATTITHS